MYKDDEWATYAARDKAKHELEMARLRSKTPPYALVALSGLSLAILIVVPSVVTLFRGSSWWPAIVATSGLVLLGTGVTTIVLRDRRREAARQKEAERLDSAADQLRERMELPSLVNFNRVLLEQYHGIATKQANKSFASSLAAMAVGLVVMVVAFYASMQFTATGERVFIGSLAALATAFVGYLSKTFLSVYDRSLQQLNQYFNQPVLNQYFLYAERVADGMDGPTKEELLKRIVTEVLDAGMQMHTVFGAVSTRGADGPKLAPSGSQPVDASSTIAAA
ncbi:hypothetical protein ACIRQH_09235 [Streptomyces sp. NPDC102279]|uniref:hypothetical protein n=1 Tax=Streptomyces sp. NPDC102279 TaxID=3366153 RepID=UPI0038171AAA